MYKVEKNVVIPETARQSYPWDEMSVGDSFFVPAGKQKRVSVAACTRGARCNEKYSVKRVGDDYRVWRIK